MLIIRDINNNAGVWHTFTVRGSEVELSIRPLTAEVFERIRKKYSRTVRERDPQTRGMTNVVINDDDKINDAIIDHVLADFKGIGNEAGEALPVTIENKKKVMSIPAIGNEQSISDFVFETSRELVAESEDDLEDATKN